MNIFELVVVQPIFNLLMGLYAVVPGRDFGVAIIIFTIIVRFVLYPLTRSMLHQTKAMRKLQPELAKIKKQSKGNKQAETMAMMELYKKHGVSPFRSIGILLIQLPIFIALFQVIQIFTNQRDQIAKFTYDGLEGIAPIRDVIANPAAFNETLLGIVDLTKTAFNSNPVDTFFLVVLAVVAGVTQYVMSKQTMPKTENKRRIRDIMAEAAEGKQADQSEMNAIVMQRMTKVLPFFMFFIMLSVPGALALYYAVSNIVAVAQQAYLLRQDEEELEEVAEAGLDKPAAKKATANKKPAKAVKSTKSTTSGPKGGTTITRITAKDTGRK